MDLSTTARTGEHAIFLGDQSVAMEGGRQSGQAGVRARRFRRRHRSDGRDIATSTIGWVMFGLGLRNWGYNPARYRIA